MSPSRIGAFVAVSLITAILGPYSSAQGRLPDAVVVDSCLRPVLGYQALRRQSCSRDELMKLWLAPATVG